MPQVIKNKFVRTEDEEAKRDFYRHLGDDNVWFPEFLYSLKRDWINQGYPVSDILIREGKPIFVAPVKTYVPFSSPTHKKNFVPTESSINNVIQKFIKIDKISEGDIYEFSFIVYGLGIFRVSYSKDENGVGMSMRYLSFNLPEMDDMQYPDFYKDFIEGVIGKSIVKTPDAILEVNGVRAGGLILHVGATGSGKSTSIAAEVGFLAENITGGIVTYESPIEYRYTATRAPVRQYEIGVDIKESEEHTLFENIKRHLLRNNPSVVVYGEARTNEEIREVIDAAARGHLVFATIHASTVMEALTTLMSITENDPALLENTLHAIIAHKLLTNKKGEFVPLYEILTPNQVIKTKIGERDLKSIATVFINENDSLDGSITFARALNLAAKEGKFTMAEVEQIKKSSYGAFKK